MELDQEVLILHGPLVISVRCSHMEPREPPVESSAPRIGSSDPRVESPDSWVKPRAPRVRRPATRVGSPSTGQVTGILRRAVEWPGPVVRPFLAESHRLQCICCEKRLRILQCRRLVYSPPPARESAMKLLDSRRLTGPNRLLGRAGAALEVSLAPEEAEAAVAAWRENVRRMLEAVGWPGEEIAVRRFSGGASLAISAPIDVLYPATEVNEWAWAAAEAVVNGAPAPDLAEAAAELRALIARETNPALLALRDAAAAHGVSCLWDDRRVSVGLGTGSLTWPAEALPDPATVDWSAVHDVPVLMVTGTNGKTTTVRLLGAIAAAAGKVPGITSTDRIEVGGEVVDHGDYSGPGGARTLLRDRRVEIAILETARGGMLRRGLAVTGADAALVTNIAADHLGEFGVLDLPSLAAAKLVIARAVKPGGRIVLNAADPELLAAAGRLAAPVTWFRLHPANPRIQSHHAP